MTTLRSELKKIKIVPVYKYGFKANGKYGKFIVSYTTINKDKRGVNKNS